MFEDTEMEAMQTAITEQNQRKNGKMNSNVENTEDKAEAEAMNREIARRQLNLIADQRNNAINQVSELQARLSIAVEIVEQRDKMIAQLNKKIRLMVEDNTKARSKPSEPETSTTDRADQEVTASN